uniref:Nuclease HARBI1 n=1 Tax=Sipha flava TaxID=143950 RepID=A0A2S2QRW0_9HEMI
MENVFVELLYEPLGEFENFTRMSLSDFEYLLTLISPIISKQDTQLRDSIPAKIRLAIMLRFLATCDSYKSLHFLFKVSSQIISKIVPEVCAAINQVLKDKISSVWYNSTNLIEISFVQSAILHKIF